MIQTNLSSLIALFADSSTSSSQTKCAPLQVEGSTIASSVTEHVVFKSDNIFADKSLFDDGTEESVKKEVEHGIVIETNQITEKESEDAKARTSSQDSMDTGFSESQPREEIGEGAKGQGHEEVTEDNGEKERKLVRKKPSNGMKYGF